MSVCTPKSFDLTGKVALITGASYGIGFAIATAMANNGATIVFNDIKQELVDKGLAAYKEAGIDAHGYVCDVTNEDAVKALVKQVTEEVGHINILVNNAGIIKRIPMTEMSAAQFRQVIDVDLNAPFIVAKSVIPDMIEQGGGKIINICSMMSELGRETVSAYAAAKGGLKMLPQVGGIGVLAPAGGTKLLVMQPHHGRSKQGQRRKAKGPQQPLFTGLRHVSLYSLIQLCSRSVSPTMGAVSGRVTSVPPFSALVCASSARGWVCSVSVPSAARVM